MITTFFFKLKSDSAGEYTQGVRENGENDSTQDFPEQVT